jgi:hypothetical protein
MTQVVGWLLHRDNTCEQCKINPAAVIVTFNGYDAVELCRNCLPEGHTDSIADILYRALKPE